ncbi:hypothetical protein BH10BAC2_BH10BAC2_40860 [soil metagenome]
MRKNLLFKKSFIGVALICFAVKANAQANRSLSNLTSPTSVNQHVLPNTNNTKDLGSGTIGWRNLYLSKSVFLKNDQAVYVPGKDNFFAGRNAGHNFIDDFNAGIQDLNNTGIGHNALYSLASTSSDNTAVGSNALYYNGQVQNTAIGSFSMYNNTSGMDNTSLGAYSLYNNLLGSHNTAVGFVALYSNTASGNTACGDASLRNNTSGASNTAVGSSAMYANTTGINMVALGEKALYTYNGSSGYNTAIGTRTLYSTTTGNNNSALGYQTLYYNTTGFNNSGVGYRSLYNNTSGYYNTAYGINALYSNKTGFFNTALGSTALFGNTGSYNTAVGSSSDVNPGLTNATAIGFGALATASNQVWLGNTSVTSVKAGNNIIIVSDGRFKKNLKENVPGLTFINQLKPVTYSYDIHKLNDYIQPIKNKSEEEPLLNTTDKMKEEGITKKEKIIYTGFVAQEVEKAADKLGYDFSGVYKPQNDKDPYGLSYAEFVVPLVKAVQELSKLNDEKNERIAVLEQRLNKIESLLAGKTDNIKTADAFLEQNTPNPFNSVTNIRYSIPFSVKTAQIMVTNAAGNTVKTFNLSNKGAGNVTINANELSAGSYYYTLIADGKKVDSKQMILVR